MPAKIEWISSKNGKKRVILSDRELEIDFVFFGTGAEPNVKLAQKVGLEVGLASGDDAELYENTLHALSFTDRGSEESKALGVQAHFYLGVARDLGVDVVFKVKDYEEESEEDARRNDG